MHKRNTELQYYLFNLKNSSTTIDIYIRKFLQSYHVPYSRMTTVPIKIAED
jgi:hypothetical protein